MPPGKPDFGNPDWDEYEEYLEGEDDEGDKEDEPWQFEWIPKYVEKLAVKHRVATTEVEECFANEPLTIFHSRGQQIPGEDMYYGYGHTDTGRLLFIVFIFKSNGAVMPVTAYSMTDDQRKFYEQRKNQSPDSK